MDIERILSIIRSKPNKIKYVLAGIFLYLITKTVFLIDRITENISFYRFIMDLASFFYINRSWNAESAFLDVVIISVVTSLLIFIYHCQKYYINNIRGAVLRQKTLKVAFISVVLTSIFGVIPLLNCEELACLILLAYLLLVMLPLLISLFVFSLIISALINASNKIWISKIISVIPRILKILFTALLIAYPLFVALAFSSFHTFSENGRITDVSKYDYEDVTKKDIIKDNPELDNAVNTDTIDNSDKSSVECKDSDGGKDYYVKGTAKGMNSNGVFEVLTDECSGLEGQSLAEKYCENGIISGESFVKCEYGCSQGVCLSAPPACYDSDQQNELFTKGYSTIDNGVTKIYDQCGYSQGYLDKSSLIQPYCDGYKLKTRFDNCPAGCKDGACVG